MADRRTNIADALALAAGASAMMLRLSESQQEALALILRAEEEGRDISDDELAMLRNRRDVAMDRVNALR